MKTELKSIETRLLHVINELRREKPCISTLKSLTSDIMCAIGGLSESLDKNYIRVYERVEITDKDILRVFENMPHDTRLKFMQGEYMDKSVEVRRAAGIGQSQTTQATGIALWRADVADKLRKDMNNEDLWAEYEYLTRSIRSILAL